MGTLAIKEEQQRVRFDRIQNTVIISHGKGVACPAVGLRGEEPVSLFLGLKRPMLHEEAIKLGTDCVRSRVALNVKNRRRRLVAWYVRHNLTRPYKAHGENVGQLRCEGLHKW